MVETDLESLGSMQQSLANQVSGRLSQSILARKESVSAASSTI